MLCLDTMKGTAQHKDYDSACILIMERSEVDENININRALCRFSFAINSLGRRELSSCVLNVMSL